jgi:hypothetical protein
MPSIGRQVSWRGVREDVQRTLPALTLLFGAMLVEISRRGGSEDDEAVEGRRGCGERREVVRGIEDSNVCLLVRCLKRFERDERKVRKGEKGEERRRKIEFHFQRLQSHGRGSRS